MSVHFKTAAVVHGLLLFLELAHLLSNGHALRNWTMRHLAFLGMDTEECPNSFANSATTHYLDLCCIEDIKK
jgi:hypothetical protein